MFRACELKDQTYKRTRTLHFSDIKSRKFEISFDTCSATGGSATGGSATGGTRNRVQLTVEKALWSPRVA